MYTVRDSFERKKLRGLPGAKLAMTLYRCGVRGLSEEMVVASLSFLKLFVQGKTDYPTVIYHRNPVTELRHLSDFIAHYFSCITQEKKLPIKLSCNAFLSQ